MSAPSLEERVAALEARLEQIEHRQDQDQDKSDDTIPWWKRTIGIHANSPGFEEAVRFGREWREAQGPPDEDAS